MKICMLGSGALGSALGGVLTEGGNDVWLIDAWNVHVDAMNDRGLRLTDGGVDRTIKVRARTSPEGIGPADLVVVLVKSYHTPIFGFSTNAFDASELIDCAPNRRW